MLRCCLLGLVLFTVGCKKKATQLPNGEFCQYDHVCQSGICAYSSCRAPAQPAGAPCFEDRQCAPPLACFGQHFSASGNREGACTPPDVVKATVEAENTRILEQKRKAAQEKEARLLVESGVVTDGGAPLETVVHPPGPGARIRVVTTKAEGDAFAACRSDERLVSGGCKHEEGGADPGGFPSGFGPEDTVGARWNCSSSRTSTLTAFALCEKLAPSP